MSLLEQVRNCGLMFNKRICGNVVVLKIEIVTRFYRGPCKQARKSNRANRRDNASR